MKEKYYLAYGSNLSMAQMAYRCPAAVYVGTAVLKDYKLLFKGSKSGNYLTIEKEKGSKVPVLVWKITADDEKRLDRYEGYPNFYYKTTMKVSLQSLVDESDIGEVEALIYIMKEGCKVGSPTVQYYETCAEGYKRFGFDKEILDKAVSDSRTNFDML